MIFKTTDDIKKHFQILADADLEIPGVYDPAEKVIESKMQQMVRAGNKNSLEIDVKKVIDTIGLKKIKAFKEMELVVEEYFSQFGVEDKLHQCYQVISLAGTQIDGKRLEEFKKEFNQYSDFCWGKIFDLRKSIKFSLGRFDYYESSKFYTAYNSYETEKAIKYIIKHFFDVDLRDLSQWSEDDMGKWTDYGNGLQGKVYKNGTFEIKHKDIDILAKEIYHYYRSKFQQYFIYI